MDVDVAAVVERWRAEYDAYVNGLSRTTRNTIRDAEANAERLSVWVGGSRYECAEQRRAIAELLRAEGFDADADDHVNPQELVDYHLLVVLGVSAGTIAEVLDIKAEKIRVQLNLYLPIFYQDSYIPKATRRYHESLSIVYFELESLRQGGFELPHRVLKDLNAIRIQRHHKKKNGRRRRVVTRAQIEIKEVKGDLVMSKQTITDNVIGAGANVGTMNSTINQTNVANTTVTAQGDARQQIEAIGAILESLGSPDQPKIRNAVADAVAELEKPAPDKNEVGQAIERALKYAEKTAAFAAVIEKLRDPVVKLAGWLGEHWDKLTSYIR